MRSNDTSLLLPTHSCWMSHLQYLRRGVDPEGRGTLGILFAFWAHTLLWMPLYGMAAHGLAATHASRELQPAPVLQSRQRYQALG